MSKAIEDVTNERQRQQTVEGWTPEHDDQHVNFEMAEAAAAYALFAGGNQNLASIVYPWDPLPTSRDVRRNLVKAAALIIAEIERIDRLK